METRIEELLPAITAQMKELAHACQIADTRSRLTECLLMNLVQEVESSADFRRPLRAAVERTRNDVLHALRADKANDQPIAHALSIQVLNDVLERAGLMEAQTGG